MIPTPPPPGDREPTEAGAAADAPARHGHTATAERNTATEPRAIDDGARHTAQGASADGDTADRAAARDRRHGVSFRRLLWVGPLAVITAVAVNVLIKTIATALDPSLARMGQLQEPLIALTVEGAVAAVVVFALIAAVVPRPIFWYRVLAPIALLVSIVPDVLLGLGGANFGTAMRLMGPFLSLGGAGVPPPGAGAGGPPPGARPPGGGFPAGGLPGLPLEQVIVLILLHAATFVVCIVLLTTLTLTRRRTPTTAR